MLNVQCNSYLTFIDNNSGYFKEFSSYISDNCKQKHVFTFVNSLDDLKLFCDEHKMRTNNHFIINSHIRKYTNLLCANEGLFTYASWIRMHGKESEDSIFWSPMIFTSFLEKKALVTMTDNLLLKLLKGNYLCRLPFNTEDLLRILIDSTPVPKGYRKNNKDAFEKLDKHFKKQQDA